MIVMVVAVVLVWLALGLFRDDAEFEPTPIDYDASMAALADSGAALAYPELRVFAAYSSHHPLANYCPRYLNGALPLAPPPPIRCGAD